MSKIPTSFALVLGALLLAGCAGDDTVNPLPPPDAGTSDASKDATASDAASAHDAADARTETPDAADATAIDASDASTVDAAPIDAAPDGD